MNQLLKRLTVGVSIREKRPTEDGRGHEWITTGRANVEVDVEIDMKAVEALAVKAANNKTGRSRVGPLTARVYKRHKL